MDPNDAVRPRWRRWPGVLGAILGLAILAVVGYVLAANVFKSDTKTYTVPSEAMEPTYSPGDKISVNENAYSDSSPTVGDVVIFHPPRGADVGTECGIPVRFEELCPKPTGGQSNQVFLKRIVAGPRDTVSIRKGHPVVNGNLETDEPYAAPCGNSSICNMKPTITVPQGDYFMLGDNRGASDDSRFWGPVPQAWVIGKVE
jgi:signal peptidase I